MSYNCANVSALQHPLCNNKGDIHTLITVGLVIFAVEIFRGLTIQCTTSTIRGLYFRGWRGLPKLLRTGCALNRALVTNILESEGLAVTLVFWNAAASLHSDVQSVSLA